MQQGSKLPEISKKCTIREKLATANNVIKQLKYENEQLKNPWISVCDKMPKVKHGTWSEKDFFIEAAYTYEIGRTKHGLWVDMNNKPIEGVTRHMEIPTNNQGK